MSLLPLAPAVADPAPIDPFAPLVGTSYVDPLVHVRAADPLRRPNPATVSTPHFDLRHVGDRLHVEHRLGRSELDDDLAGLLAEELFTPGWLRGGELFERLFTGLVRSSHPDPLVGWGGFYRNSLRRIADELRGDRALGPRYDGPVQGHGGIAGYAPVYQRAEALTLPGSVLELGSCFGFLALRLAATGRRVTASDLSGPTMRLLAEVAPTLGLPTPYPLRTVTADAARFPAPDGYADTVLAVHLLEHVDARTGAAVLAEATRLARRRVVVAVPLEDVADATWGHVRTVSLDDLHHLGADLLATSRATSYAVSEHHGGWLTLDLG